MCSSIIPMQMIFENFVCVINIEVIQLKIVYICGILYTKYTIYLSYPQNTTHNKSILVLISMVLLLAM